VSRALGLVLAAVVLVLALWPPATPPDLASDLPDSGPLHPAAAALDLVLPGLFTPVPSDVERFNVRGPWADALGLPGPPDNPLVPTHAGFIALLLALVGMVFARGAAGWAGRAALVAGLLLLWLGFAPGLWAAGRLLLLLGVATLAGAELHALGLAGEGEDRGQAALALGGVAVLGFALLAFVAIRMGQSSDWVVARPCMARFLELVPDGFTGLSTRETLAAVALRSALDRAALASFAAMTALLIHLKARSELTGALVIAVAAAEIFLSR
jgi:hypothetical protein